MLGTAQWLLDVAVLVLLAATLFHALRLHRALGVLSRDRPALEALVNAFNVSTQQAENGIERLRNSAEGVGRTIARQNDAALSLKDDLTFLIERGDRMANRLDALVRAGPPTATAALPPRPPTPSAAAPAVSAALPRLQEPAGRDVRGEAGRDVGRDVGLGEASTRVRSQAERDLITALRTVR